MEEDSSTRKILDLKKKKQFLVRFTLENGVVTRWRKKIETKKRKAWTSTSLFVSCP